MSEYTREEILKMIEENGGPEGLDLSGKDLSEIDLSAEAITKELEKYLKNNSHLPRGPHTGPQGRKHRGPHPAPLPRLPIRYLGTPLAEETPPWFFWLTGGINLHGAILKKANLSKAHLEGAHLVAAHLEGADLPKTRLEGAILAWAHLEKTGLLETHLEAADLWGAYLEKASLWETRLEGANLGRTHLAEVDFFKAHLEGADLTEAHLEKVDLSPAASLDGAYFYDAFLDQTRMKREQLGDRIGEDIHKEYYQAKEAYLLLKNNFNQIGRYDDASWAYVKEREMEKMSYHPKLARMYYAKIEGLPEGASPKSWTWWRFYVKYTLKWIGDWFVEWSCGYGENPWRVIGIAVIVLFAFPFLYWLTGLTPTSGQNILWQDRFLYSLYAFGSMEHPTLQATSRIAQLFTGLESLSGIALLALLMYTLGRRISRS